LYEFFGSGSIGLSPCVPLEFLPNSEKLDNEDPEFAGTMCLDMQPKDSLNQYFDYEEDELANYLIYNPDQAFKDE
jgi:hypothetical protein